MSGAITPKHRSKRDHRRRRGEVARCDAPHVGPRCSEEGTNEIICFPEGVKQAVRKNIVVKYLEEHKEQLETPAEVVIYMALKEAWPCPE